MNFTQLPFEVINNLKIRSNELTGLFNIPIATFETTLFKSLKRGALVSRNTDGIFVWVGDKVMTRSIILEFLDMESAIKTKNLIERDLENLAKLTQTTSRFCKFESLFIEIVGSLMFARFSFLTSEAAGHNMTTKAMNEIGNYISNEFKCKFVSVSGNLCTDKKNSAINGIIGRGIKCNGEIKISRKICEKILKTTPEQIEKLVYYKNYIGSSLAGSIRSANAHFANIIAAFYIATGQDVANIVEGSQGFTFAKVQENELIFSVSIPNIILGSIGNGKDYDFVKKNIQSMNISSEENLSKKFAIILTAAILCSELSLLSALTNNGELIESHIKYERGN